ncbi:hypothetical protein B0J11DRAFT_575332 [Dendryphion nanum]|uniref:Uncharacterized protein n=1 Tax=Dendryphion nanum TaxID=256645 RepID=A0A9P9EKE3_9PLEO|nr:hypothetical protein B0J11DRAFT_575332 [Dendryphion nanum]
MPPPSGSQLLNTIKTCVPIGVTWKGPRKIPVHAATQTVAWRRTDEEALRHTEAILGAVNSNISRIPGNAVEIISRDNYHDSKRDPASHITAIVNKDDGGVVAVHLYPDGVRGKSIPPINNFTPAANDSNESDQNETEITT